MEFSEDTVKEAWERAEGRCECKRTNCDHSERCNQTLIWNSRGSESEFGWEVHHINANGTNILDNCEILCQKCHKNTGSYGG